MSERSGSADFHAARALIGELHDKKQADYGADGDPFANIRQAVQWGLPASLGACIRIGDKVSRLKTFYSKGELANESVEDAYLDLAVYALIGYCLFQEESRSRDSQRSEESWGYVDSEFVAKLHAEARSKAANLPRTRCPRCFGAGTVRSITGDAFEQCRFCGGKGDYDSRRRGNGLDATIDRTANTCLLCHAPMVNHGPMGACPDGCPND